MTHRSGYTRTQIAIHWAIAALVVFNYIYSDGMGRAFDAMMRSTPGSDTGFQPAIHVWVGMAVLALIVLRMIVRLGQGAPEPGGSGILQSMAVWVHRALYALMLAVPVFGAVTWFGRIGATGDLHAVLANTLLIVAGLHAAAALAHQFILRDGLLMRMIRPKG
ncbi:cytochrome b [Falsirhodobacter halotolerans]|uniref:cytochrome b n=1 Tax=Falsirhodobacter halotolerans TaxID=1146892 RepID=UPI001FD613EB|nr:cytochrome b/b6 domain-containing protein [Falsirhodobacter halotolerans]MCJ8140063.1 cytochrome b/b6 domain-containing protein [Falsirhodobacter halotolerans]